MLHAIVLVMSRGRERNRNYASILYRFRVIAHFSSKVATLTHSTCICRPLRGWSRSNFAVNFGVRKPEFWGYHVALFAWYQAFKRINMQRRAKFHQNRSNGCGDITFFTARRLAKRSICRRRVSVCVSVFVCVSVTLRYCIKTAKRRITQITPHDSPMTLVFWRQR